MKYTGDEFFWKAFAAGGEEHVAGFGATSALRPSGDLIQTQGAGLVCKADRLPSLWEALAQDTKHCTRHILPEPGDWYNLMAVSIPLNKEAVFWP